ncbi:hypothetical protein [Woodsholea maritima]|uniref:hypothetical protein n=1 Tax=Woodsholea maritima TaxID=240237 RepID=UPI0012E9B17E|nr:hypothetical protein [Woodsholea maritima]
MFQTFYFAFIGIDQAGPCCMDCPLDHALQACFQRFEALLGRVHTLMMGGAMVGPKGFEHIGGDTH